MLAPRPSPQPACRSAWRLVLLRVLLLGQPLQAPAVAAAPVGRELVRQADGATEPAAARARWSAGAPAGTCTRRQRERVPLAGPGAAPDSLALGHQLLPVHLVPDAALAALVQRVLRGAAGEGRLAVRVDLVGRQVRVARAGGFKQVALSLSPHPALGHGAQLRAVRWWHRAWELVMEGRVQEGGHLQRRGAYGLVHRGAIAA
jgi:hypothetical protein